MLQFKHHSEQKQVPLKRVSIEATIRSFAADVTITQVFRNDEKTPIEAVYCFPIEEQAAVYAFRARIDDREIVTELKKKDDAQRTYVKALQQGHGAYLLEQDEKSLDNFIVNVGALLAGTECHITISYVTELDLVQNGTKIRFTVPTTIAPRYNPNIGSIDSPAETTSKYVQSSPYTIEFRCRVEKIGILRVCSVSHPIQVSLNQDDVYVVEFAQENTHLDRDILLDIELAENRSNTIVAVESGAIMASFTPTEEDCRRAMNMDDITNEFIFVVDCSGSMDSENKIELAREAILLFVKSLPVGCHFNIIRFGSMHKNLFDNITAIYDQYNVEEAENLIENMHADLGGTELLLPLQWLKENPPVPGHSRQIFLLTDGEISNVDEVLNLCRSMSASTRIFSFGLGLSPSRSLVKGLARATNGGFVFIPPYTNVDSYVSEQLQKALQPCITNVQIKWNLKTITNIVPINSPPVYVNDRLIVYAFLDDQSTSSLDHNISVELYSGQHRLGETHIDRIPTVTNDQTIVRLATKALILELQHEKSSSTRKNMMQECIVGLSLKYNILSPYTAFFGIEKRINATNADMVLRKVPIQISADDQHLLDQQLCYSKMSDNEEKYNKVQRDYEDARRRYQHVQICCREALHHYQRASWELVQDKRQKESLEMDYFKSLNSSEYHDGIRSSRTHHYTNKRHGEPQKTYHDAQNRYHQTRMSYIEAWNNWESYQEERNFSELNYFDAFQALLSSCQNDERSGPRIHEAYEHLKKARIHRQEAQEYFNDRFNGMLHYADRIDSSENDYYDALQSLDVYKLDMLTERNTSSNYTSYGSSASNSHKMKLARSSVDDDNRNIVRELIRKQKFDGLWDMDSKSIEQLIGKPLADFQQWTDTKILTSGIIIVVLETRFVSLSSMWYNIVQKARKCLSDILNKSNKKLDNLLEDIKKLL